MKEIERYLENFPKRTGDTYERLQAIVEGKTNQFRDLKDNEKMRLEQELSVVKEAGISCVILFFYDIKVELKDVDAVFHGVMHCSYLCYVLGLTRVNPFDYNLPFERYFGKTKKQLPLVSLAVKKGCKGRVIQYLKKCYGVDRIARLKDWKNEYVISDKSLTEQGEIVETILHTEPEKLVWHEDVSSLTKKQTEDLGLYTFTLQEANIQEYRRFSEEEIYQKTLAFLEKRGVTPRRYRGNEEVEKIFSSSDGRYVYQEQFYEICTKILGVNDKKADEFRYALLTRNKQAMEDVKQLFAWRLKEEGVRLFEYINGAHFYAVSKAYVIGLLFLDFLEVE